MTNLEENKKVIKLILGKKKQPKLSGDFTQKVMSRVLTIEITKKRDLRRSWLWLVVGVISLLLSLWLFSKYSVAVAPFFDHLLPGLFNYYLAAIGAVVTFMLFYQLNNLLTVKVSLTNN